MKPVAKSNSVKKTERPASRTEKSGNKTKASPVPRLRHSVQEPGPEFKVPLRQMPIERAPAFKKSSVSDMYYSSPAETTPTRKWSAPASRNKERTPSPSAGVASLRNKNNKDRRTPSPKQAPKRQSPSPRLTQSFPKNSTSIPVPSSRATSYPSSPRVEEEDVNVKERAAVFGPRKSSGRGQVLGRASPATPGKKASAAEEE